MTQKQMALTLPYDATRVAKPARHGAWFWTKVAFAGAIALFTSLLPIWIFSAFPLIGTLMLYFFIVTPVYRAVRRKIDSENIRAMARRRRDACFAADQ